jgi:hypothetical protein
MKVMMTGKQARIKASAPQAVNRLNFAETALVEG